MRTLYRNADILCRGENGWYLLKNACLGVNGAVFDYVSETPPEGGPYDETVDLRGKLVMPGLINCHTHAPMVLLRGVGSDLPLQEWLFKKVMPIEDKLFEDEMRVGTELAAMEMLAGGTVSFSDMYFYPHVTADVIDKVGMKANLNRPVQAFDPNEKACDNRRVKEAVAFYDAYNGAADGRILIDFCIHAEYTCNEEVTRYLADIVREKHGNLHIHLSETEREHEECRNKYGKTPARWFADLGAFDSNAFAAHCVAVDADDVALLREKGVAVVHNPTSNMKLGSGFAPVQAFIDAGLTVALGTDGAASNNNLNMFEEMHLSAILHNGLTQDPTVMKPGSVLDMATVNGAAVQRRAGCGEIRVGNRADFIALDMLRPHLTPCLDAQALLVYSAQGSDVWMTVCDGRVLYKDGEYLTIDAERVYHDVARVTEKLYG
ncbi:MAG: amidohydrolase [Clostridia bacterium]|nr:amidohydrolase [Clostridia bacterium]